MNTVQKKDIQVFVETFVNIEELRNKVFLITGATGLIGSTLCYCLLELNNKYGFNIRILCPVRNIEKFNGLFSGNKNIIAQQLDIESYLKSTSEKIDYIVHCASPTAGKYMTSNPVETYAFAIESTLSLLHYAQNHTIESMVYVSSLEYYGQILDDETVTENKLGYVDPLSARSSYPLGKRAAEYACVAYAKEYDIPVRIARLTQTFGAGISKTDNRVFAQFAKSAINGKNIILKSSGKSSKPYCYTTDAISGILTILLKGSNGDAYNVSNDKTYISISDMANLVKKTFNPNINIIYDIDNNSGYAPDTLLRLSSRKLQGLGWKPKYDLKEMYRRLIEYLKS